MARTIYSTALFFFFVIGSSAIETSIEAAISFSQCASYGYEVGSVACSTCEIVQNSIGHDSRAAAACFSCCTASLDWVSPKKYDTAVLKVRGAVFILPRGFAPTRCMCTL